MHIILLISLVIIKIFQIKNDAKKIENILDRGKETQVETYSNVTRVLLAYLPPKMPHFVKEFKAFFLSIAVMRNTQPKNIKTDFIIFAPKEAFRVPLSVGCVREVRYFWVIGITGCHVSPKFFYAF